MDSANPKWGAEFKIQTDLVSSEFMSWLIREEEEAQEHKIAEEKKKADELQRAAEKEAEDIRKAEAEESRKAEEAKKAEETRKSEEAKKAEEKKKADDDEARRKAEATQTAPKPEVSPHFTMFRPTLLLFLPLQLSLAPRPFKKQLAWRLDSQFCYPFQHGGRISDSPLQL